MKSKRNRVIILAFIYIFVFISFGFIYWRVSIISPDYFVLREDMKKITPDLFDFIYFSVVTITTLGYGDILPNSKLIRLFIMIESISGVTLMGILISSIFRDEK